MADDFEANVEALRREAEQRALEYEESILDEEEEDEAPEEEETDQQAESFRIPKRSEFAAAGWLFFLILLISLDEKISLPPPLEESRGRPRTRLPEEVKTLSEQWLAGIAAEPAERESTLQKVNLFFHL